MNEQWDFVIENGDDDTDQAQILPLTFFSDLPDQPSPKPWLIKGVMARDETSSWIAPPAKGKSSLLTSVAVHNASGRNWRGYRTKQRSGVVYFAWERGNLVRRRLIAHRQRDGLADLPIAIADRVINLLDRSCVDIILATIRNAEQRFGCEVGLAIFDTYAKGVAAGNGDEDKAKDQNIVLANMRRIFERGCHIHIASIGHTGKDESRGERGSNAKLADVDLQVQISGDNIKTAEVTKANDQPEGLLTAFKLEPFNFAADEDGDASRVYIVADELIEQKHVQRQPKLNSKQKLAMRALAEVTLANGRDPPPNFELPHGIKVVDGEVWRTEMLRNGAIDPDTKNIRARYSEMRATLASRFLIGSRDQLVWMAATPP